MKPYQQLRRVKASERIYSWLVRFYPAPFRAEFGNSMKQVFRDQCLAAVERKGTWGLLALWLRVLPDFVWTCPKEHLVALPTLPRRAWAQLVARPIWLYPMLATTISFLIVVAAALQLPQLYPSTAIIYFRFVVEQPTHPAGIGIGSDARHFGLEPADLKAVLHLVIERLDLQEAYQTRLGRTARLTKDEVYELLVSRVSFRQAPNSAVLKITVYDDDKELAKAIAEAIASAAGVAVLEQVHHHSTSTGLPPSAQSASQPPVMNLLKLPEVSDNRVRPDFRRWVLRGGVTALAIGGITLIGLWIVRRLRNRAAVPA